MQPFSPRRFGLAAGAALLANLLVLAAGSLAGGSMRVVAPVPQTVTVIQVVLATLLPLAVAGGVVLVLAGRLPLVRPLARWAGLGFALLSMLGPLSGSADPTTGIALAAMHAITGIAWAVGLRGYAR